MHDSLFFYTTPFLFMSTDGPRRCNSIINEKQTSYWQLVINLFFENFGKIIVEERNDRRGYLGISSINIESEMYIDEKNIFFSLTLPFDSNRSGRLPWFCLLRIPISELVIACSFCSVDYFCLYTQSLKRKRKCYSRKKKKLY